MATGRASFHESHEAQDRLTKIPGISLDRQILATDPVEQDRYKREKAVYATSTYDHEHHMNPGLIVIASNKTDIATTLQYAKGNANSGRKPRAVAIRTGGHQYSGASSTDQNGILLDLRKTFSGEIKRIDPKDGEPTQVRTSVSWSLGDFSKWMGNEGTFVPHGQCIGVYLGGHCQTGGYGQLGRSFGLFGDHVVSFELCDPNSAPNYTKIVDKDHDPDLFYAILGGSPGNFGVLTHLTITVYRDQDYPGPQGLWALHLYSKEALHALLTEVAKLNDDNNKPRNYDLCVSVLSESIKPYGTWEDLIKKIEQAGLNREGVSAYTQFSFRMIVVYAQWVPFSADDRFDPSLFKRLKSHAWYTKDTTDEKQWAPNRRFNIGKLRVGKSKPPKPKMSELTSWWLFQHEREFNLPYVKRTYVSNSQKLEADGWVDWCTNTLDSAVGDETNGLFVSAQFQPFGGKYSQTFNHGSNGSSPNGTSYSWRDATMVATIDCFHRPGTLYAKKAVDWQSKNDADLSPTGPVKFTDKDRRMLWGSYRKFEDPAEFDMRNVWRCYYDDETRYKKLQELRAKFDPIGIYTPNTFCVPKPDPAPPVESLQATA